MKKTNLILMLLFVSLTVFSQSTKTETKIISEFKIKSQFVYCEFQEKESTKCVLISYQNNKYQQLTDVHSIVLNNKSEVDAFSNDLKEAFGSFKTTKSDKSWDNSNYNIMLVHGLGIDIYDANKSGAFTMSFKDCDKLCSWMDSLIF